MFTRTIMWRLHDLLNIFGRIYEWKEKFKMDKRGKILMKSKESIQKVFIKVRILESRIRFLDVIKIIRISKKKKKKKISIS